MPREAALALSIAIVCMFADDNGASLETVHKQTFVPSLQYCSSTFLPEACDETSACS